MATNSSARLIRLFCFLLASVSVVQAQEFPFDDFARLRNRFPADANVWTETQYTEYNRQTALLLVDVVWRFRHLNTSKPNVRSVLSAQREPPTWDGNSITYPVSFARDMVQLGFMLGRDIYIGSWRRLPEDKPITQHPFSNGHLVKAIDSSINSVSPVFDANASLIMCPDTEKACAASQTLEALAVQLFLVAHECGHYVLGHQAARNLEQELAADQYAWDTLRVVAQSFHTDDERSNQYYDLLFAAAAEAPLWYQRQSKVWSDVIGTPPGQAGPEEDTLVTKRIEQIDKLADDLNGDNTVSEFMPSQFKGWNVQPTIVSFERPPQMLVIDGVSINSDELSGGKIRLPSEGTNWIATDAEGVSCRLISGGEQVVMKYTPWVQTDIDTIANLAKAGKWCDVIAATGDSHLRPRSPGLAPYLNRALYHSGAGDFIDPAATQDQQNRADAERYRRISVGVRSWGLP